MITKCRNCAGLNFGVSTIAGYDARLLADGTLVCEHKIAESFQNAICVKCEAEYNEADFRRVKFE